MSHDKEGNNHSDDMFIYKSIQILQWPEVDRTDWRNKSRERQRVESIDRYIKQIHIKASLKGNIRNENKKRVKGICYVRKVESETLPGRDGKTNERNEKNKHRQIPHDFQGV